VINDALKEGVELLRLRVRDPISGAATELVNDILIEDNDAGIQLITNQVPETAGATSLLVTLASDYTNEMTVSYRSLLISPFTPRAVEGIDFEAMRGEIKFPAGRTSVSIPLTVLNDVKVEGTDYFEIEFTNQILGAVRHAVAIEDNDLGYRFGPVPQVGEGQGHFQIPVYRLGDFPAGTIRYRLVFSNESYTAHANAADFSSPLEGELRFAEGETNKVLTIALKDDDQLETGGMVRPSTV
jgi:hypothetical protein